MGKIWYPVYFLTLTVVNSGDRSSQSKLGSFVSERDRVKRLRLEVNKRFLLPVLLFINSLSFGISPVCFVLHFALIKHLSRGLLRHSDCVCQLHSLQLAFQVLLLTVLVDVHGCLEKVLALVCLHGLLHDVRKVECVWILLLRWRKVVVHCLFIRLLRV